MMKSISRFLLICLILDDIVWGQEETVFHCSVRPECQVIQCDSQSIGGWNEPGFDVEGYLNANEFPITCQSKQLNIVNSSTNLRNMIPEMSEITTRLSSIERDASDLLQFRRDFQKKVSIVEELNVDLLNEITQLKSRETKLKETIRTIRNNSKIAENNNKITFLVLLTSIEKMKSTNEQSENEINTVKKSQQVQESEFNFIKNENTQLRADLNNLKEENQQIRKILIALEEKVISLKNPKQLEQETGKTSSVPVTASIPTPRALNDIYSDTKNKCEILIESNCYWMKIHSEADMDFAKAESICQEKESKIAQVPDESTYDIFVKELRLRTPGGLTNNHAWIGITVNPTTREVFPSNSYTKWNTRFGGWGISKYINVFIVVDPRRHGMRNSLPTTKRNGVICQRMITQNFFN
uniref:colorectal mutant cancer protein-like n=1 Tax=Styela clava TaxID=7725 RepID=UPI00193A0AA1|nr:colorectal mutant cancer protein-like [Styela clava]